MSLNSGQEWNGSMHAPSLSNKASKDRIEYLISEKCDV